MSDKVKETQDWLAELRAENERLRADLAKCYKLSGADPDGNEDWRLAPKAVKEVRDMRASYDAAIGREIAWEDRAEKADAQLLESGKYWEAKYTELFEARARAEADVAARDATIAALREGLAKAETWVRSNVIGPQYFAFEELTKAQALLADPDPGAKIWDGLQLLGQSAELLKELHSHHTKGYGRLTASHERRIAENLEAVRALKPETKEGE